MGIVPWTSCYRKTLKAAYVKHISANIPYTHDLVKIAEKAKLELTELQKNLLDEITTFNIKARYPDFKGRFYKKATRKFTERYIVKIKELRKWLIQKSKHNLQKIKAYIKVLEENDFDIWRLYLFGSYAKHRFNKESDIDLAIFLNRNDIDGFEEDAQFVRLRRKVDMRTSLILSLRQILTKRTLSLERLSQWVKESYKEG